MRCLEGSHPEILYPLAAAKKKTLSHLVSQPTASDISVSHAGRGVTNEF